MTHIHFVCVCVCVCVCWYHLYEEVADLLQQDHYPAGFTVELRPDPHQTNLLHHSRHVVTKLPITDRVMSQSDGVTANTWRIFTSV